MSAHPTPSSGGSEEGLTKIRTTIRRVIQGTTALVTVLLVTIVLFTWHPWTDWGSAFVGQGGSITYRTQATAQCPGGSTEVISENRQVKVLSHYPCQVRIHISGASPSKVAELFDNMGRKIGETRAGSFNPTDDIIYQMRSGDNKTLITVVTVCPLGASGSNIGSCN